MKRIILASGSPRRKELMSHLGIPFEIISSQYEEDNSLPLPPRELVERLSLGKAKWVAEREPNAVIISADTLGFIGEKVLGKPRDNEDLAAMIAAWNGGSIMVYTGMTVMERDHVVTDSVKTKLTFRKLTNDEVTTYIAIGEGLDKAGGCAIQDSAASFIDRIEGDYYGTVGLPLSRLAIRLQEFGVHTFSEWPA